MFDKGSIAFKIAGRDSGVCTILDKKDGKLLVLGPIVRKRWVNPSHLEPLEGNVEVDKLSEDELIEKLRPIEQRMKEKQIGFLEKEALKAKIRG